MEVIGEKLKASREEKGLSLEEVSEDLKIEVKDLRNIESGNRKSFDDIFILKKYIYEYAKYLGLDYDKFIEEFNEYVFEYTSKIPTEVIERISKQKEKEEINKGALSPYTMIKKSNNNKLLMLIIIILFVIISMFVVFKISDNTNSNDLVLSVLI